jgi:RNA polymerase sigma-70 factor (ECF subfamily)
VARFQAGDRAAFDELYVAWAPRVRRFFENALADAHAAEDATQRVFIDVLRALPRYRPGGDRSFEAWLFTVARHRAWRELRARGRVEAMEPEELARLRDRVEEGGGERDDWLSNDRLAADFAELSPRARQVLALRYELGFSNREIAELIGITPAHVGMLQQRARQALAGKENRRRSRADRADPASSVRRDPPRRVLHARRTALATAEGRLCG